MTTCATYQSHKILTEQDFEPVSLEEAKLHLRVDQSEEDAYITALINAARVSCENYTGVHFVRKTVKEYHAYFPYEFTLRVPNVDSVSTVAYIDENGDSQTFPTTNVDIDTESLQCRITVKDEYSWPSVDDVYNAVSIEYTVGYEDAASVPQPVKQAMLLMIGKWYQNREDDGGRLQIRKLPTASENLLNQYREWEI